MAEEGGVGMLINLMTVKNEQIQRQACKALANLGVNGECDSNHLEGQMHQKRWVWRRICREKAQPIKACSY